MLTKWGKAYVSIPYLTGSYVPAIPFASYSTDFYKHGAVEHKNYNGDDKFFAPWFASSSYNFITSAIGNSTAGIAVGSGDTPASEDDYNLESIITGLSATNTTGGSYDSENNKFIMYSDYTISNNTGEAVVIKEIGRFATAYTSSTKGGTASSNATSVLVDRTVLDEPVTIPDGEAGVVRYSFEYLGEEPEP